MKSKKRKSVANTAIESIAQIGLIFAGVTLAIYLAQRTLTGSTHPLVWIVSTLIIVIGLNNYTANKK